MILEALVRRLARITGSTQPSLGEFGELLVSLLLPQYAKLNLAGKLFGFDTSGGTAQAPQTTVPTTTAEWTLYNNSQNEVLIPLHVAVIMEAGTSGLGLSIIGAAAIGKQTAVTSNYASTIMSAMDGSQRSPAAYLDNASTLVGGTPAWVTLKSTDMQGVAGDAVEGLAADHLDGLIVARPGGAAAFDVIGETGTTALFYLQGIFAMIDADFY